MPAPKKGSGKQSKAGRREAIEREYAEAQRINAETVSCTKRLIDALLSGGVPESSLTGLRKCSVVKEEVDGSAREVGKQQIDDLMNSLIQFDVVADESWSFAFCYPSINVDELIANLNELRSLMCGSASLARTSAQRKVGDFRSDPKADAALVDAWTETAKQLNDVLVMCKIGAYKTRALVNVATKERYKPERRLNEQRASGDCGNLE